MSAVARKSITDLTGRKARTFFTILTLALAVASVGILAVSPLMDQSMKREVAATRLSDLTVSMKPLKLSQAELARLAALPNVTTVEPRSLFATRVYVGARVRRRLSSACRASRASGRTSSPSSPARRRPSARC
jgi:putative ABC transport system permease protein